MRRLFLTLILLCGLIGCASAPRLAQEAAYVSRPEVGTRPMVEASGWGGFPLSPELSSLWLSRGITSGERPQPLVMVFYKGSPGWHDKKWEISSEFGKAPPFIKLISPELTLSIEQSADGVVRVQRQVVDLSQANIYLVRQIDGPMMGIQVTPLGLLRHPVPAEANPPVFVLDSQREIAAEVYRD